jgi:hypothetical protein
MLYLSTHGMAWHGMAPCFWCGQKTCYREEDDMSHEKPAQKKNLKLGTFPSKRGARGTEKSGRLQDITLLSLVQAAFHVYKSMAFP